MRTAWGYDVSTDIQPIISVADFNTLTGGAFSNNSRVESALKAASQAIRNYCGWHICPSMNCTAYPVGGSDIVQLPAGYVGAVTEVTEDGAELTGCELRKDGLLRKADRRRWSDKWDGIVVSYTAGYDSAAVPDLVEAVVAIASGVLSIAPGVVSESADGVTISYSANAASIAASLTSQQKSALEPYRIVCSHAV